MSERSWTPGPWIVKDDDAYDHIFSQAKPHRRIAAVYGGIKGSNELDLINRANARLIAAAPEMFELLETIENDDGSVPPWLWEQIQEVVRKVKGDQ